MSPTNGGCWELKLIRIMLETWNMVRKYTPIYSFRKYTFWSQGPLNFADVSLFYKNSAFFLKNKIYKYMSSISRYVYINKSNDIVNKYNNKYHRTIKIKLVDVNSSRYIDIKPFHHGFFLACVTICNLKSQKWKWSTNELHFFSSSGTAYVGAI